MITVLIVDDQSLIRQAVGDILGAEPGIEVLGQGVNGADAIAKTRSMRPDVVIMDIRMPEVDGIAATAAICGDEELANTKILILTTFEEDEYLVAALRAGASGFIGKASEPEEIVRAVQAVNAGDSLLSPAATKALIARYVAVPLQENRKTIPGIEQLTDRESEVLLLVASGYTNQEIAERLFISPHTAKTHINRTMAKLQVHDRAQLVIIAYEAGLIIPGFSAQN